MDIDGNAMPGGSASSALAPPILYITAGSPWHSSALCILLGVDHTHTQTHTQKLAKNIFKDNNLF